MRVLGAYIEKNDDAVLVSDSGEIGQWAQAMLPSRRRLVNGVSGAIGSSLSLAMAARCAEPTAPVFAVLGDGSLGFHIAEFETAIRCRLPFVAIIGNDGSFLGIISRGIAPANLEAFLATVSLAEGEAISIVHRDGTLLARYPHIETMVGHNFKQAPIFQKVLLNSDHGTIRLTSSVDGKDRIAAIQSLASFPLSVVAASTVSVVLSDWYEQVQFLVIAAALSMLVITAQSASITFTASSRPPSPTSRITRSSGVCMNTRRIASIVNSK